MSAGGLTVANLGTVLGIQWRTGWKTLLAWVGSVVGLMAVTVASLRPTYDTPEKVAAYARSLGAGPAIEMLNGQVAGLDSFGGIIANEFGFIASFLLPLMGVALVARATRREEESGRLELLLAAAIGRHAPLVAALIVMTGAAVVMGLGCWVALAALDVEVWGAAAYSAGLASLVLVFGSWTAVAAQLFENSRGVWMAGLVLALASYLVRGIGSVNDAWYRNLAPHGLFDSIEAFASPRWWPLLLLVAQAGLAAGLALWLNARRDLGGALVPPRPGPPRASATLRHRWGLAAAEHAGATLGWVLACGAVMAMFGSLAQQVIDALRANPDLTQYVAAALDEVLAMFVQMASMLAAAAGLALAGSLRSTETAGRLELLLAGPEPRPRWLARHLVVMALAVAVVLGVGALVLAGSASASLGNNDEFWPVLRAGATQLPVVLAFLAVAVAVFTWAPRWRGLVWAGYGMAVFIAYMGKALDLPDWLVDNSPFLLVGRVPATGVDWAGVGILVGLIVASATAALWGIRRRDIPTL